MIDKITLLLPYTALLSHFVFVVLLLSLIFRKSWGAKVANWLGRHALPLAFLVAILAVSGSLFYSEVVGFEPCVLCWWQRVFTYPLMIIFGTALLSRNKSAFLYAVPLSTLSAIVALYHSYVYLGGKSFIPCTAVGGACSKIYVMAFGYITIPMMSLTIALYILLLAWANKVYK